MLRYNFLTHDHPQELQRKLAEEQVAAAMGQAPPVASVSAGAAALSLTMGGMLPGAGAAASKSPAPPVRRVAQAGDDELILRAWCCLARIESSQSGRLSSVVTMPCMTMPWSLPA